jgi:hypothetical protein
MKKNGFIHRCALVLLLLPPFAKAQTDRSDGCLAVGYQYADFGHSLSASEVQMMSMNTSVPEGGNRFTNGSRAFGLVTRCVLPGDKTGESGFYMEFTLANKKVLADQTYRSYAADSSSFQDLEVSTKQRLRYFSFGTGYAWKRLSVSASADLGVFTSLIRYEGGQYDGKWQPWFKHKKLFGSGDSGKSPVIASTFSLNYLLTDFLELRIHKQFTAFGMGAGLSNRYFSVGNWGAELTFRFNP